MSINHNLINTEFNSYKLGRFVDSSADSATYIAFPAPLEPVPIQSRPPQFHRNRLVYFNEDSLEIENFYYVDAVGVHSFRRENLFPFPESSVAIAMVRVQSAQSPMLAASHGQNQLTILQTLPNDQSVSILFNQTIPVPDVDGVTQPFAIEHASLRQTDGFTRIHVVLSSSRVQQPQVTEEHVQPFVLRPIQFEAEKGSASITLGDSSGRLVQEPSSSLWHSRPIVSHVVVVVTIKQAANSPDFVIEHVSEVLEGGAELQCAVVDHESLTLVSSKTFASMRVDGSQSDAAQREEAPIAASAITEAAANSDMIDDNDNDVTPELLAHFTSDKMLTGKEHLMSFGDEADDDDADEQDSGQGIQISTFKLAFSENEIALELAGYQDLGQRQVIYSDAKSALVLGAKYDVDLCLFRLDSSANSSFWRHFHTFSALAYVASGKRNKKFLQISPDGAHACIGEHSGYVFVYEHEQGNSARQQIVRLPEGQTLMGLALLNQGLAVLTNGGAAIMRFM